ncbi:MAG: hypothetical protein CMF52_00340 [Legionellales bacterium]|nr:hypothetical protein [Legionellales bacterium]|tara:strand:- start:2502 stop:3131 length:630 start_codon:yes stop_codon:yes gene_type:complete
MKTDSIKDVCKQKNYETARRIFGTSNVQWYLESMPLVVFWSGILISLLLFYVVGKRTNTLLRAILAFLWFGGSIVWYFYGYLSRYQECAIAADPMNKKLFSVFGFPISTWPLSHFVLWVVIATLAPKNWKLYIGFGVAWEVTEYLFKTYGKETVLSRKARTRLDAKKYQYLTYWESAWEDIALNSLGIVTGTAISQFLSYDVDGILQLS